MRWLWREAKDKSSVIGMFIFCLFLCFAGTMVFVIGISENDRLALKAMQISAESVIRISRTTGVSPSTVAQSALVPVGLSGDVFPTLRVLPRDTEADACEGHIDDANFYIVECPFRSGASIYVRADRSKVLAPLWRDVYITAFDTTLGVIFLMWFSISAYRRRKKLESTNRDLASRNRMLETMTFSLHHDMAGPANDIRFSVDMMRDLFSESQMADLGLGDVIEIMSQGAERQESVLRGLREWMRAGDGKVPKTATDLNALVRRMVEINPYPGPVEIGYLPVLAVNCDTFCQVLDNLIRNGFHYNDKSDPVVRIYATNEAIIVEDNGEGFDDSKFDLLTQPFQRGGSPKSGNGLGLAISRTIVESHGFTLSAESKLGVGSKFYISFRGA